MDGLVGVGGVCMGKGVGSFFCEKLDINATLFIHLERNRRYDRGYTPMKHANARSHLK